MLLSFSFQCVQCLGLFCISCGSHFHFSLRAQRGIVALQRVASDGGEKGHCCVFVSVLVSYVVPQAGGQRAFLVIF